MPFLASPATLLGLPTGEKRRKTMLKLIARKILYPLDSEVMSLYVEANQTRLHLVYEGDSGYCSLDKISVTAPAAPVTPA